MLKFIIVYFPPAKRKITARCNTRASNAPQLHPGDAIVELFALLFDFREGIFGLLFIVDVDFAEALADFRQRSENFKIFDHRGHRGHGGFIGFVIPTGGRTLLFAGSIGAAWDSRFLTAASRRFGMTSVKSGAAHKWGAGEFAAEVGDVALAAVGALLFSVEVNHGLRPGATYGRACGAGVT
jgi:hypothetical protein